MLVNLHTPRLIVVLYLLSEEIKQGLEVDLNDSSKNLVALVARRLAESYSPKRTEVLEYLDNCPVDYWTTSVPDNPVTKLIKEVGFFSEIAKLEFVNDDCLHKKHLRGDNLTDNLSSINLKLIVTYLESLHYQLDLVYRTTICLEEAVETYNLVVKSFPTPPKPKWFEFWKRKSYDKAVNSRTRLRQLEIMIESELEELKQDVSLSELFIICNKLWKKYRNELSLYSYRIWGV